MAAAAAAAAASKRDNGTRGDAGLTVGRVRNVPTYVTENSDQLPSSRIRSFACSIIHSPGREVSLFSAVVVAPPSPLGVARVDRLRF
jgi:hypothetical protein